MSRLTWRRQLLVVKTSNVVAMLGLDEGRIGEKADKNATQVDFPIKNVGNAVDGVKRHEVAGLAQKDRERESVVNSKVTSGSPDMNLNRSLHYALFSFESCFLWQIPNAQSAVDLGKEGGKVE